MSQYAALIVGLGNPGKQYALNRHNVGFQVLDAFANKHGLRFSRRHGKAEIADGVVDGKRVLLAKPQTFVNVSGDAVTVLLGYTRVGLANCLVVYDELDLPLGQVRLREKGGSGGHNGLKSIIGRLGSQEFPRLRIGIGRPPQEATLGRHPDLVTAHVLGNFAPNEKPIVADAIASAIAAIELVLRVGVPTAMNTVNVPRPGEPTAS